MKAISLLIIFVFGLCVAEATESTREISLERTACYGPCPVYTVTIYANGLVVFEGLAHVKNKGHFEGHIAPAAVVNIQKKADEFHFWSLEDKYITKRLPNGSTESVTDLPTKVVTIKTTARSKTVVDYYGAPKILSDIERLIDDTAGTSKWIDDQKN